jgi:hypothetical protein
VIATILFRRADLVSCASDYENIMQVLHNCRLATLWVCAALILASTPTTAQQPKPNILFILADNVGYGDIGAYGVV